MAEGVDDLIGYATDYAFGDKRGLLMCDGNGKPSRVTPMLTDNCCNRPSKSAINELR
jgi:hypothetical protein